MTTAELDIKVKEVWDTLAELAERFKETERIAKETTEQMKRSDITFKEMTEHTDQKFSELAEQVKRTDKRYNERTDKWGLFVEGLVVPAAKKMFGERGIELHQVFHRAEASKNGPQLMEVDVLATGKEYAVLIEAKSTLKVEDINEHLERMENFKECFPQFASLKTVGAVAGIVISENADKYAYKKGLYVIVQSGETVMILNDNNFAPNVW